MSFAPLLFFRKREFEKALADCDTAIQLDPDRAAAYAGRGFVWAAKQDYDKAMADLSESIRLDSEHASTHFARA